MNENTENAANGYELASRLDAIVSKLEKCGSELSEAADSLRDGSDLDHATFLADEAIWGLYYEVEESLREIGWKPLEAMIDSAIMIAGVSLTMKEHSGKGLSICPDLSRVLAKRLDVARIELEPLIAKC